MSYALPAIERADDLECPLVSAPVQSAGANIAAMRLALAALAASVCCVPAAGAVEPQRDRAARPGISQEQAIRIARGYGMVQVTNVEREDDGWEIEGRDHRGRQLEVNINRQGRVTSVERDDDD